MARVIEGSHSFTCHPHVYPQVEWTIPAFTPQPQSITALWLVLISRPAEGRRLSWPGSVIDAQVPSTTQTHATVHGRPKKHILSTVHHCRMCSSYWSTLYFAISLFMVHQVWWRCCCTIILDFSMSQLISVAMLVYTYILFCQIFFNVTIHVFGCPPQFLHPLTVQWSILAATYSQHAITHYLWSHDLTKVTQQQTLTEQQ